jgi:hypothetical protein
VAVVISAELAGTAVPFMLVLEDNAAGSVAAGILAAPVIWPPGRPVAFVSTRALGVPRLGVTKIGDVAETGLPVPVAAVKDGAAVDPVKLPKCVLAAAVESAKV